MFVYNLLSAVKMESTWSLVGLFEFLFDVFTITYAKLHMDLGSELIHCY